MTTKNNKIIAIVGPTASGKTGIGVKIAKDFNGEIISADSRQVFRGLDIGSGKEGTPCQKISNFHPPTGGPISNKFSNDQINDKWKMINEKLRCNLRCIDGVPQWLIDIREPEEEFHLFDFIESANIAIADIFSRGKTPIVVGGTGLYVQGLIEGFKLNKISNIKNQKHGRKELESFDKQKLQNILNEIDPKAYEKVDKDNPHRLIRAIERFQEGTEMQKATPGYSALQIGITWPREVLYDRIDKRVDQRFDDGMLEEVQGLINQGVDTDWLMRLGLEYRVITKFLLRHEPETFADMSQVLKYKIHQFAKRQTTWFKRFPEIVWENDYEKIRKIVSDFLD